MKRLASLLIVVLLAACSGTRPEEAISPNPEEPIGVKPTPALIRVASAHWETGSWNSGTRWRSTRDFGSTSTLPHVTQSRMVIRLEREPDTEQLADLTDNMRYVSGPYSQHVVYIDVDEDAEVITLPSWMRHDSGKIGLVSVPDVRVVVFNAAYPWIQMDNGCIYPLRAGETVGFSLMWPFDRQAVEAELRAMLASTEYEIRWSGDDVLVTLHGTQGVEIELAMIPDEAGGSLTHGQFTHRASLQLQNQKLVRIDRTTGQEQEVEVPLAYSGIKGFSDDGDTIFFYLALGQEVSIGSMSTVYEYAYSLTNRDVYQLMPPYPSPRYYPETMHEARGILQPLLEAEGISSYGHSMSPSGRLAVAMADYGEKSFLFMLDTKTGEQRRLHMGIDLIERSCKPVSPFRWSHDEKYIVGPTFLLDIATGELKKLGEGFIFSVSPYADLFIYHEREIYLANTQSERIVLEPELDLWSKPIVWVGIESVIVHKGGEHGRPEWLEYDIANGSWSGPFPGEAIAYDPATNSLYVVRKE